MNTPVNYKGGDMMMGHSRGDHRGVAPGLVDLLTDATDELLKRQSRMTDIYASGEKIPVKPDSFKTKVKWWFQNKIRRIIDYLDYRFLGGEYNDG